MFSARNERESIEAAVEGAPALTDLGRSHILARIASDQSGAETAGGSALVFDLVILTTAKFVAGRVLRLVWSRMAHLIDKFRYIEHSCVTTHGTWLFDLSKASADNIRILCSPLIEIAS